MGFQQTYPPSQKECCPEILQPSSSLLKHRRKHVAKRPQSKKPPSSHISYSYVAFSPAFLLILPFLQAVQVDMVVPRFTFAHTHTHARTTLSCFFPLHCNLKHCNNNNMCGATQLYISIHPIDKYAHSLPSLSLSSFIS